MLGLLDVLLQALEFDSIQAMHIWTSLSKKLWSLKTCFLNLKVGSKKVLSRTILIQEVLLVESQ